MTEIKDIEDKALWQLWVLALLPLGLVLVLFPDQWPRYMYMWTLVLAIFAGFKWMSWQGHRAAPLWQNIAYLYLWPGLDARSFLRPTAQRQILGNTASFSAIGLAALGGIFLFYLPDRIDADPYLIGWIGMIGFSLIFHFAVLQLLGCFWRSRGVQAQPFMNKPLTAQNLADFWGKHWNTAFRDFTHRFLFKPLRTRLNVRVALLLGFLFSGLLHELVITVPAGGAYGGPTLYFLIQGFGILIQRQLHCDKGFKGWLFTLIILIAPAYLLFPPIFVENIMLPFMQAIGALS